MEASLPALRSSFSRTVGLTVEILRQQELAEALNRGIADLAAEFGPAVADRVYVRIPLGEGWLEGWYEPSEREFEPIAWMPPTSRAA
ncbi:MAG: hypothetical protein FJZ01_18055 [Candidatus Sericytochromatia bacterium]|nr:hypothetical protein [Candidatus Tanganyikabacteria bacterium]